MNNGFYNFPSTDKSTGLSIDTGSFAITGSNQFSGSQTITGSLNVTQGITGSFSGTASFAISSSLATSSSFAVSSSRAISSSFAVTSSFATSASFATQALSASFAPGTPAFPFTGSALITGSLGVTGSLNITYNTAATNGISVTGHYPRLLLINSGPGATAAGGILSARDNNFATKVQGQEVMALSVVDSSDTIKGAITWTKDSSNSTNTAFNYNSSNNTAIFISGSGNVGIKTTTPTSASLTVNGNVWATSFTGSLFGTSSWASNATTASFAVSSSRAVTSSFAISSSYTENASTASFAPSYLPLTGGTIDGNVTVNGTASIAFLNVTYESASVIYSSGSNVFGDATNDVQTLIGTVIVSGSQQITGSLYSTNIIGTGSLFLQPNQSDARFIEIYNTSPTDTHITASGGQIFIGDDTTYVKVDNYGSVKYIDIVADNGLTISASIVKVTGSLEVSGSITGSLFGTSSYAVNAATASNVLQAVSSSFASTASYVQNAQTASYILNAVSSSFATTASYVLQAVSSSFATTSSYALNGGVTQIVAGTNISITNGGSGSVTINSTGGSGGTDLGLVQAMTLGLQNIF